MWDELDNVNEQALRKVLKNECPQTVAIILGKIGQAHSAKDLAKRGETVIGGGSGGDQLVFRAGAFPDRPRPAFETIVIVADSFGGRV